MREIKFRCWNGREKQMILADDICRIHFSKEIPYGVYIWGGDIVIHGDCILMQYTGLKDKNSKEIYEGDIIKYKYEKSLRGDISKVEWQNEYAGFSPFVDYDSDNQWSYINLESIEVIGNIYENPKLLEK